MSPSEFFTAAIAARLNRIKKVISKIFKGRMN